MIQKIISTASVLAAFVLPCSAQSPTQPVTYSESDFNNWSPGYVITGIGLDGRGTDSVAGESFSIGSGNALVTSIMFPVVTDTTPDDFQVGVAAWNGTQLTGPLLYLSGDLSAYTTPGSYEMMTVNPNNLILNQGQEYMLFWTSVSYANSGEDYNLALGYVPAGGYANGQYFGMTGYELGLSDLSGQPWSAVPANIAFDVNYQLIPEPGVVALLGLSGLIFLARRRN